MTILNEENDDAVNPNLLSESYDKQKNAKTCNERSDSGFSECSSCSTPSASCVCSALEKNRSNIEEKIVPPLTFAAESHTEFVEESPAGPLELVVPTLELFVANKPTLNVVEPKDDVVLHVEPTKLESYRHEDSRSEFEKRKVFLTKKAPTCKHGEISLEQLKKNSKVAALMEKFETSSDCVSLIPRFRTKSTDANEEPTGLSTNTMSVSCMISVY